MQCFKESAKSKIDRGDMGVNDITKSNKQTKKKLRKECKKRKERNGRKQKERETGEREEEE